MSGRNAKHYLALPDNLLDPVAQQQPTDLQRPVAYQFKSDLYNHFPGQNKLGSAIFGTKYIGYGGTHTPHAFTTKTHDINGHHLGMTRENYQRVFHEHPHIVYDPFTMAKHGHKQPPPEGLGLYHPHTVR